MAIVSTQSVARSGIAALPDDVLHFILRSSLLSEEDAWPLKEWQRHDRSVYPLVCKKWRDLLYMQGRPITQIALDYTLEHITLEAVGDWIELQQERGIVQHPVGLSMYGSEQSFSGNSPEILGSSLNSLAVSSCDDIFRSRSLRSLWVAPSLTRLSLCSCHFDIDMEDFNAGVMELRQLEYFKIDPGLPDNDSLAEMDLFFDAEPPDDDSRSFPQWGFTSFPEVFCQLPNLQGIHMLRQQLGTLPAALSNLKKLASLQLDMCSWRRHTGSPVVMSASLTQLTLGLAHMLPDEAGHVEPAAAGAAFAFDWGAAGNLIDLNLHKTALSAEALTQLALSCKKLRTLDLSGFEDLELQHLCQGLCHVKELKLLKCELQQFPAWLFNLTGLEEVTISFCDMVKRKTRRSTSGPALSTLRSLRCGCTRMLGVDDSLCSMTGLTALILHHCEIRTVSPCISKLTNLQVLDLSSNRLAEVSRWSSLPPRCAAWRRLSWTWGACRLPLHADFSRPQTVHLSVTEEEKAALAPLIADMGRTVVDMDITGDSILFL